MNSENNNSTQTQLPPITECQVPRFERQIVQNINQMPEIIPQPEVIPQNDDILLEPSEIWSRSIELDSLIIGENLNISLDQPTDLPKQ